MLLDEAMRTIQAEKNKACSGCLLRGSRDLTTCSKTAASVI